MSKWFKSSKSWANSQCVEVNISDTVVSVRDSKNPEGPCLEFTRDEWTAFVEGAKTGEFDLISSVL